MPDLPPNVSDPPTAYNPCIPYKADGSERKPFLTLAEAIVGAVWEYNTIYITSG